MNTLNQSILILINLLAPILLLGQEKFTDVTAEAGINHSFAVFQGTFGGGAAVIDYDLDGWEDLFIAGGAGKDQLLRNQGDGSFRDVSEVTGIRQLDGYVSQGAAVADVNRDGWPDLYVTTIAFVEDENFREAPNVLLINNGDGTFSDRSAAFGLTATTFSTGASFGDVNRDGYPDLYVCNYFENYEGKLDEFYGPQAHGNTRPAKDLFYLNDQGRAFVESSERFGIERSGLTFQALWSDVDNDNDLDILVANDFGNRQTPDLLYRNEYPNPGFTEIGAAKKFDFGINAMGIGACDINGDGRLDYLVTNIQVSPFFINQGPDAPFLEESVRRGAGFGTVTTHSGNRIVPVSWGVNFFDVDHDSDTDLYIVNGCLNPSLTPNPNLLLENVQGHFVDYGFLETTNDQSIGRGSVVFDYDHDGDLDILVVNQAPHKEEDIGVEFLTSRLYRNDNGGENSWIKIKLNGRRSETHGIGSRIELFAGQQLLVQEIYGGSSHESQNSTIAHFGLGPVETIDSIRIKWSASETQVLTQVPARQTLTIDEPADIVPPKPLSDLQVYPNPFAGALFFDIPEAYISQPVKLTLSNLLGQVIFTQNLEDLRVIRNSVSLPPYLNPGVYLLSLEGNSFRFTRKLIKGR